MCNEGCQCSECHLDRCAQYARDTIAESWDEEYVPPWKAAVVATENQKVAWGQVAGELLDNYKCGINMPAMISMVCQKVGVRPENWRTVSLSMERFFRESPDFKLVKGKHGGIFRTTSSDKAIPEARLGCPPTPIVVVPSMHRRTPEDNYTCGCGNSKLCTDTDKSCWKCGAPVR
jgi:hypothetical protein